MQQLLDAKNKQFSNLTANVSGIIINPKVWRLCLLYMRLKNMTLFSQVPALYPVFTVAVNHISTIKRITWMAARWRVSARKRVLWLNVVARWCAHWKEIFSARTLKDRERFVFCRTSSRKSSRGRPRNKSRLRNISSRIYCYRGQGVGCQGKRNRWRIIACLVDFITWSAKKAAFYTIKESTKM